MLTAPRANLQSDRLIRIAYVVYSFAMGGLERCVAHFVNHLPRDRFRPMVICLQRTGPGAEWIARDDVPVVELHKRAGNDLQAVRRLARVLTEHQVDVVQSHNWGTLIETTIGRRWARVASHVHTEHGQELDAMRVSGLKRRLRGWATRWALGRAEAVIICAESVRGRVHARSGFPQSRMQFIANGVEDPSVNGAGTDSNELRARIGISKHAFVVGSLSRLAPVKDFGTAIEAIAVLRRRGRNVHLVLAGDGPESGSLRARSQEAGVDDRVHLVGRQDDAGAWLSLFDVYVNSSLSEAMSMGILEAMATGLPIVATDVGDNKSIVLGSEACGLIIPPANPRLLADALDEVLADGSKRRMLGRIARKRYASEYSVQRMVRDYQALYRRLGQRFSERP